MSKVKTYVLLADIHYPEHDKNAWLCVLDFIRKNAENIDGLILMGDALDLSCISHHNTSKPLYRPKGALKSNLDGFARDVLDPIDDALGPKADKRFLMGNHEAWLTEQLAETNPELDGMLDLPSLLNLEERDYQVIPQGGFTRLGKLVVAHGDTLPGGMYAAKRAVETWCRSIAIGHHHTLQQHVKDSPADEGDRWVGTAVPCLCHLNPTYARGKANRWLNGFGVAYVRPNGDFNLYPIVILNGQCVGPDGRVYGKPQRKAA